MYEVFADSFHHSKGGYHLSNLWDLGLEEDSEIWTNIIIES